MKKLILALLFVPSLVLAQQGTVIRTVFKDNALNAVASNAAEASRTFYVDYSDLKAAYEMKGPATLGMDMFYDYSAAAGTITTTCYGGNTRATATRRLTTCTVSSGTCTINMAGVFTTASLSADTYWIQELGLPVSVPVIKCIVAHSAPAAGEKFTVDWYMSWE